MFKWTAIRVDSQVQEAIRGQGRMGESFNDVLRRLLNVTTPSAPKGKRGRKANVTKN